MTVSTRANHMDLIFDLTEEEVEVLRKAIKILDNVTNEVETVAYNETDFSEVSVYERKSGDKWWFSVIDEIINTSIGINDLLQKPIFDDNPILTEEKIDD